MPLFENINEPNEIPAITEEIAQGIYSQFKIGKDISAQFKENGTIIEHAEIVLEEIKRLEEEVTIHILSSGCPETKEELASLLSSYILDVDILIDDCILYNPTCEEGMTFTEFIASYQALNEI